jgi:haloalkane dehalogenase
MINAEEPDRKQVEVNGRTMAYVEMGEGDPVVFQHGNPTSAYLWRNIMPKIAPLGRCIAVDMIGMGESDKLEGDDPDRYRYAAQRDFLFAAWEKLGIDSEVTFVLHDWGSVLGFEWARENESAVSGIAYMESIVRPLEWDEWPDDARDMFKGFRSDAGEEMVLEKNLFVERVLPASIMRLLTDDEMAVYRRPFEETGESRRPTLTWPRELPIDGEPADVVEIVEANAEWLKRTALPKLFINAEPGAILTGAQREFCRQFQNQKEVTVPGIHFIQEDSPDEIAAALFNWMAMKE